MSDGLPTSNQQEATSLAELPEPLTPPDCDLRDFPRFMINVTKLFGSSFNAKASRHPLAWMLGAKLWFRSWHQVPAGSLPDDDDELCYLAELGFDRVTWDSVREMAMHGWIKCNDGRLYHPVVAGEAIEGWERKLKKRHMTYCASIRKHNERHPDDKRAAPSFEQWQGLSRPERVTQMSRVTEDGKSRPCHAKKPSKGQGQGQGQGQPINTLTGGAAARGTRLPDDFVMPGEWKDYARTKGHSPGTIEIEAEKFTLHWQAETGRGAAKRDWKRAWQKWVLGIRPGRNMTASGEEYLGV